MPQIWLPDQAQAETVESEDGGEAARVVDFNRRLRALDDRLDCFLQTQESPNLRKGFYYVRRRNENGTVATWEISNPDDSFREPDERVLAAFRRMDSRNRDVWRDEIVQAREQAKRRQDHRDAHDREERLGRGEEVAAFHTRLSVRPKGF